MFSYYLRENCFVCKVGYMLKWSQKIYITAVWLAGQLSFVPALHFFVWMKHLIARQGRTKACHKGALCIFCVVSVSRPHLLKQRWLLLLSVSRAERGTLKTHPLACRGKSKLRPSLRNPDCSSNKQFKLSSTGLSRQPRESDQSLEIFKMYFPKF